MLLRDESNLQHSDRYLDPAFPTSVCVQNLYFSSSLVLIMNLATKEGRSVGRSKLRDLELWGKLVGGGVTQEHPHASYMLLGNLLQPSPCYWCIPMGRLNFNLHLSLLKEKCQGIRKEHKQSLDLWCHGSTTSGLYPRLQPVPWE